MRWKSVIPALVTLTAVLAVSLFSLVKTNVLQLDAAAIPVYANSGVPEIDLNKSDFLDAQEKLKSLGITLSNAPDISLGFAKWSNAGIDDVYLYKASKMLSEEFVKYDSNTIKATGLKKIYLVTNLAVNGQLRSGMPEPVLQDALYFDVSKIYINSEDGQYIRRTFHHELKHLIDYNKFGNYTGDKANWLSCNDDSFRYGAGGGAMYADPKYAHSEHPITGFVDGYATSAIEEDRAEVYAMFMTTPEKLQTIADKDSGVACKLASVKESLSLL